jgi:spore coat protein SA
MRKAAFVTPGAYPLPSSMGGSVERVVEKFVPLLQPNIEARIYGRLSRRLASKGNVAGVSIERFAGASKARYFRMACIRMKKYKPSIIQVENRPLWVPRVKRAFPDSRIGLNLHSTTFIRSPYMSPMQRTRCLQAADYIQVNSEFLRSYINQCVPKVEDKIKVNHLGVDAARFPGKSSCEGRQMGEQGRAEMDWYGRPVVLYVGRLIPQKGVHHLLSTLPQLISKAPNVLVVIVGSALYGSHRKTGYVRRLHRLAKKWKGHVHFQPYVPHYDIPRWYAMADIAVVPSIGQEAFGLVNLEAMAAELPVVATRAGGIGEIVEDGRTGYLVPAEYPAIVPELASRIGCLLTNEGLRLEMGARGRERVMNYFLWEHTARRWLDFQHE